MHQSMPYWVLSVLLTCACAAAATELTDMLGSVGLLSVGPRRNLLQSDICGAQEYFCGETDMVLDTAYNAVVAGNCYNDTADTGVFYCGEAAQPIIIVAATYNTIASNLQNCPVDCANSAASSSSTTFYWQVSAWSTCSTLCDGGIQTRDVLCHSAVDGSQVSNSNCDQGFKPSTRQACNKSPCAVANPGLTLGFTAWGECSVQCGSGYSSRTAYCMNPYGLLADVSMCGNYTGAQLSRTCTAASCSGSFWKMGQWSDCSTKCNGGVSNRTVQCVDKTETPVDISQCAGQLIPASSHSCNTAPCVGYTWQVGDWESCSASCGNGVKNRTVSCVDDDGLAVNSTKCVGLQPEHQAYCNDAPCDFCATTDCSSQGTCRTGVCVCKPGYRGTYCEVPPECGVILDVNGNCCNHGIISADGICCGPTAVLDRDAVCCESGKLDACGACDGTGLLIDVQNVCCNSSVLDAGGFCCASGLLDDCGVCDGDGSSCALHVVTTAQVTQESLFLTLSQGDTFAAAFATFLADVMGVDASHVEVADLVLQPGTSITSTSQATIAIRVDTLITPADSFSADQDLGAALAARNLQDAIGNSGSNQLFILLTADVVERQAICDNQVCEAGERPSSVNGANGGCSKDCGFILKECPIPAGGTLCSGVGWCMSSQGICQCYLGYAGDACDQCDQGYTRVTATGPCVRNIKTALPPLDRPGAASLMVVLAIGISLGVLGLIALAIAGCLAYRWHKEKKGRRRGRRRSNQQTLLLSPSRADSMTEDGGNKSRSESMLDVARGLSASLQNIRREFSGQSGSHSPQRSAHSVGVLPGEGVQTGTHGGARGLSVTKTSGLSSSKRRDAMRRTAASRLAERKEDIAAAVTPDPNPQAPNPQGPTLTKSPSAARRVSGEPAHHSKAAAFLLKNPKASVSMMRRSPSKKGEAGAVATAVSQIEAAASPFELAQEGYSNEFTHTGTTINPLTRVMEETSPGFQTLTSASSGELSTTSSRALLGSFKNSS